MSIYSFGKVLSYIFDGNKYIYIYIYICVCVCVAQGFEALNSAVMGNRKNVIFWLYNLTLNKRDDSKSEL